MMYEVGQIFRTYKKIVVVFLQKLTFKVLIVEKIALNLIELLTQKLLSLKKVLIFYF